MHKFLFFVLLLIPFININAQSPHIEVKAALSEEFSIGGGMLGLGFNTTAIYGRISKPYRTTLFNIDFAELRSGKERTRSNNSRGGSRGQNNSSAYVYGKQNNCYLLRAGWGNKHYISEKQNDQSVTLALSYQTGISLAMLKPYYLHLYYRSDSSFIDDYQPYTPQNAYLFLDPTVIRGAGGFGRGWDDLKFKMGIFAKGSLWIDFKAEGSVIAAIELGLSADFFSRQLPIMVANESAPVFLNVHANIHLGGRW